MKLRWILLGIVLVGGVVVAGGVMSGKLKVDGMFKPPGERPLEVQFGTVGKNNLVRTVSAPGNVEPKTKVQVSAQVLARIIALPFREGERVKSGDVIVRLDGRDLAAALESAQAFLRQQQATLASAEADLVQAKSDFERSQTLFPKDITKSQLETSEAQFLRSQSRVAQTKAAIEQARAAITRAQKDLENTTITSPIDGIITKLNAEVGETVVLGTLNNAASVIMEIADLDTMLMKARVDEVNIAPVSAGQRVRININAYKDREFLGVVERVGLKRQVETNNTSYFEVEIALQKPKDLVLGSGLTANADIEVETFTDVMTVPSQAVQDRRVDELPRAVRDDPLVDKTRSFARVVYVVEEGRAKPRPVKIGASDLTSTVVLAGLAEGQKIVVGPYRALTELKDELGVVEEGTKDEKGNPVGRKAGSAGGGFGGGGRR